MLNTNFFNQSDYDSQSLLKDSQKFQISQSPLIVNNNKLFSDNFNITDDDYGLWKVPKSNNEMLPFKSRANSIRKSNHYLNEILCLKKDPDDDSKSIFIPFNNMIPSILKNDINEKNKESPIKEVPPKEIYIKKIDKSFKAFSVKNSKSNNNNIINTTEEIANSNINSITLKSRQNITNIIDLVQCHETQFEYNNSNTNFCIEKYCKSLDFDNIFEGLSKNTLLLSSIKKTKDNKNQRKRIHLCKKVKKRNKNKIFKIREKFKSSMLTFRRNLDKDIKIIKEGGTTSLNNDDLSEIYGFLHIFYKGYNTFSSNISNVYEKMKK